MQTRQRGMTLLEVLVSLVLISFGLLGMVSLQARATQFSSDAEDRNRAALLANELISTMWTQRTVNLPAATITTWQTAVANTGGYGLPGGSGSVALDAAGAIATITISWTGPSKKTNQYQTQVTLP